MPSKRTVLITGCSDGSLGSALALAFHKAGWRVFASARNMAKLKNAVAAGIETVQLDVGSDESVAAAVAQVKELTGGSLDTLVNNAGAGYCLPLLDIDLEEARNLFDLNVFSLLRVTRAFFPLLVKSKHGGLVVNNTSGFGFLTTATPFYGVYCASKAAAASFTEVLRLELEPFGIRVVNLVTGSVKSTFFDNAPKATLPPTSLYNAGKERIERAMSSEEQEKIGSDPTKWAESVVRDLNGSKPPHLLFRGKNANLSRLVSILPVGLLDSVMKQMSGLDVFEKNFKDHGGLEAIKASSL
ncbi:NAD(P)-binding protein [Thozetella sp. PMI_491]|nr:NAD(P)-binding protein [Thozetella sp. PMI_491]